MIIFLILLLIFLLCVIAFQFQQKRTIHKQILSIKDQLTQIVDDHASGPVLIVTENKEMAELLVWLNKLIEQNREHSSQFIRTEQSMRRMLSNISHDLKTPLTVIAGYTEILKDQTNLPEKEWRRILHKVNEKTDEITTLIHSFFDLAKLEAGDHHVPLDRVNLTEICKRNILMFYEMIESQRLDVNIDLPDTPIYALANEEALNRVLSNLFSNALRYGSGGNVVGLRLTYDDATVSFEVYDKGTGIHEYNQEKIFERMYTLDESRNKEFQGSGLGLTITKRLMEKMHGRISVYSKPYEKTSFICTLKREHD
ncbi:sensor histidine kinase [Alkalicoccobacillus porphyridii]|uniref:histidine kinase n=1 Tax=Alkalicoccobacillus porphyridii TaxID=2597270 RepID=A0A554A280_9BACI|nr:sensor histidine kinase [Alkalicoccobacillus porphyridii]TSB47801.1 HAMP domain-containing histidine kinase [Alkalicoccobacillus porphyridii]